MYWPAGPLGDGGVQDVLRHRHALLGLVRVGLALGLDVDRASTPNGVEAAAARRHYRIDDEFSYPQHCNGNKRPREPQQDHCDRETAMVCQTSFTNGGCAAYNDSFAQGGRLR